MKTRVFEVIGRLQDGGAETLVKDYALLIDKDQFELSVIPFLINTQSANYKILKGSEADIIPLYKSWNSITRIRRRLFGEKRIPLKLKLIIEEYKPDVIHVHLANLHYLLPIKDSLKGIKIVYTCHNLPSLMFSKKRRNEFEAAKYLIKDYDMQMIALHDDMAKELDEMFGVKNTLVIRNGINLERFKSVKESKNELRKEYNIPDDAFVIGHVGRFTYQKNHEFLMNVFYELYKKNNKAFLLMIGDGEYKEESLCAP